MSDDIIGRSDEASKGIYQAIKRVEGVLQPLQRKTSKFETGLDGRPAKDQVEIVLEEAVILEMDEGEEAPELTDDTFTTWLNYAQPGKDKPSRNTFFVKGFCVAGEELAKARGVENGGWRDLVGTRIILEKRSVFLFKRRKADDPDEYEEFSQESFVPVECEGESGDIKDYVRSQIVGKNKQAAKRAILLDNRIKRYPEYKDGIDTGEICKMVGVSIDSDGKYHEDVAEVE